jgi:hypothetical protein
MTKEICEISASTWFYYKEIFYDAARSHERKKYIHPLREWMSSISVEKGEERTCNYEPLSYETLSFLAMFEDLVQLELKISTYFSICCIEISYTALRNFQNSPLEVCHITTLHRILTQVAFTERS